MPGLLPKQHPKRKTQHDLASGCNTAGRAVERMEKTSFGWTVRANGGGLLAQGGRPAKF